MKLRTTRILLVNISIFFTNIYANNLNLPPLKTEFMTATIYTKEFAERFNLPAKNISHELTGGLQAIEFSVEKGNSDKGSYLPIFKLYFDRDLPILYPDNMKTGSRNTLRNGNHLFYGTSYKRGWSNSDIDFYKKNEEKSQGLITGALLHPKKRGSVLGGMVMEEFYQDIVLGISYIKVWALMFTSTTRQHRSLEFWIRKNDDASFRRRIDFQVQDCVKLKVPDYFLKIVFALNAIIEDRNEIIRQHEIEERVKENKRLLKSK